eukprot:6540099-Lingulodinium_polyedra.AAC.1
MIDVHGVSSSWFDASATLRCARAFMPGTRGSSSSARCRGSTRRLSVYRSLGHSDLRRRRAHALREFFKAARNVWRERPQQQSTLLGMLFGTALA